MDEFTNKIEMTRGANLDFVMECDLVLQKLIETRQVSEDHSLVAQLMREGKLTKEEACTHEDHNKIYRSLGEKSVEVDTFTEQVQDGDRVLLRTDGL